MIVSTFIILKKEIESEMKMKKTWFGGLIGKLIAVLLIMNMLVSLQAHLQQLYSRKAAQNPVFTRL